jgi:hypothetical protein
VNAEASVIEEELFVVSIAASRLSSPTSGLLFVG